MPCAAAAILLAGCATMRAQQGLYFGSTKVLHRPASDTGTAATSHLVLATYPVQFRSGQRRMHVSVLGRRDTVADGDLVRWADTVAVITFGRRGDTVLWLGVRHGAGYSGSAFVVGGADAGRYGKWAVNLASGDSLPVESAPTGKGREKFVAQLRWLAAAQAAGTLGPDAPQSGDGLVGWAILILFFLICVPRVAAGAGKLWARLRRAHDAVARLLRDGRNVPRGYAAPCSICGERNMQLARELLIVKGRLLFTTLEHCILAGCNECVTRVGLGVIGRMLLDGPWSLGGIIAAPGAAVMDLFRLFQTPNQRFADRIIREAGLDPDAVRLDEDGFTRHERYELHAATGACARIIWSDRRRAPNAYVLAEQHLRKTTGGRLPLEKVARYLDDPRGIPMPQYNLSPLTRSPLYRLFKQLATADGPASPRMYEVLRDVMHRLGFAPVEITDLLLEVGLASRTEQQKRSEAHARAHTNANAGAQPGAGTGGGAGARSGPSGGGSSGAGGSSTGAGAGGGPRPGQDGGARQPRSGRDDLTRARAVLGVSASASWPEILTAFRTSIAIWHPDRAGLDAKKQAEFTRRTQEITWAKDALRRAATIPWT